MDCRLVFFSLSVQSVVAKGLLVGIAEKSNYVPVFLNFSAQTSSVRTQEMIEGKLEKKRKNILGRSQTFFPHAVSKNSYAPKVSWLEKVFAEISPENNFSRLIIADKNLAHQFQLSPHFGVAVFLKHRVLHHHHHLFAQR